MAWTISHGTITYETIEPSYTTIATLGQHLAHTLPGDKWALLREVFDPHARCDRASFSPAYAVRMAAALEQAAAHRLMPRDWGELATRLAEAARRAAAAGDWWVWS
ncbi:DUF7739 domain-containing protein [Streptomyces malaysiensis]|uniref:DUF7739 domain-containing protein n=1 Tax=Streptomyces malaysiensis TaxID=92644 RepID=UPI0011CE184D|nr:hypothetical protein [Streptomyces malaysiensis]